MSTPYLDSNSSPSAVSGEKIHTYHDEHDPSDNAHTYHEGSGEETVEVTKVRTSGDRYVHLGNRTYLRSDLQAAFGGDFNPGLHATPRLRLGNSSPMGLFAFATTTLILSLINAGARSVHINSIMLGCALFYGGVVQIFAGIWELVSENTFGATVFTTYGGFWMSFAVISMNGFNIASAYKTEAELANAMGIYFIVWSLVCLFFILCTLRSTVAMFVLLVFLLLTFIMLAASEFTAAYPNLKGQSANLVTAAGVFGCITSFLAYYNAMAGLLTRENSWIQIHAVYMPGAIRPEKLKEA